MSGRAAYVCVDGCGAAASRKGRRCYGCYLKNRYPDEGRRTAEWKKGYLQTWHQRLRAEVFGHYGGFVCACCGETQEAFLVLDHINGGGNAERRTIHNKGTRGGSGQYIHLRRQGYPPGYQVLCHNCNFAKSHRAGGCPCQRGVKSRDA